MSRKRKAPPPRRAAASERGRDKPPERERPAPQPVDVVDGVPDRAPSRPLWKLLLLAGIFLAWVAFLVYCAVAGGRKP